MHQILFQFVAREIEQRYRGSLLGLFWSVLNPLLLMAVFTFVFAVVMKARWGQGEANTAQFALIIFAGLTTFNLFAEVTSRAPTLVVSQPNLVKKVAFPLQILPVVAVGGAVIQTGIAVVILLAFQIALGSGFHLAALLLPLLVLPLCLFTLGVAWFLAALGVYVRDVVHVIPPIITTLMFLSPIFYPSTALPEWIRPFAARGPLAYSVETVRDAVIFGKAPDAASWLFALAGALIVAALGYVFFQKTRKGFADVL